MPTVAETLALALQHHQSGRLSQAEKLYHQVLQDDPANADAWHLLGVAAHHAGRNEEAIEHIRQAIALDGTQAVFHNNLGLAYRGQRRLPEALACFDEALRLNPGYAIAHNNWGLVLQDLGRSAEAETCFRKALQLQRDFAEAHNNLGIVLRAQGRLPEAVASYREALRLRPGYAEARNNLQNVLNDHGKRLPVGFHSQQSEPFQSETAVTCDSPGHALPDRGPGEAVRLHPDDVAAHNNRGNELRAQGKLQEAVLCFRQALRTQPDHAAVHNNLGVALNELGELEEAVSSYQQALRLKPNFAEAHNNLGLVLAKQGRLDEAAANYRQALQIRPGNAAIHNNLGNVLKEQGQLAEALHVYRQGLRLQPDLAVLHSNLLLLLNYDPQADAAAVFAEHCRFGQVHGQATPKRLSPDRDRNPERRLRVGYVSPDFRRHAVARQIEPVLAHHDPQQVEIVCYAEVAAPDETTVRLQALAAGWRWTCGKSAAQIADWIAADRIDILVDLAGHTAGNRLDVFALKPAPVQATWLGYPNTTGLTAIDYLLTDDVMYPPGEPVRATEQPFRLPECLWCFAPAEDTPLISPLPAQRTGQLTFGSPHGLYKINSTVVDLWCRVLKAVPTSRLLMFRDMLAGKTKELIHRQFTERGIASERLDLRQVTGAQAFLKVFSEIDVTLDVFPYTGATTTCESLWMGAPVLSLCGTLPASRCSATLLAHVGLNDWVVQTPEAYVARAVRLATELDQLAELRARLRERLRATLCDVRRFTQGLEDAYRTMWRRWCAQSGREEATLNDRQAPRLQADEVAVLINRGNAQLAQGQLEDAVNSFRQALRLQPDNAAVSNNLGVALQGLGNLAEAALSYEQALRVQPDLIAGCINLGNVRAAQGDLDGAVAGYRQALRLQSDCVAAHNNLGNALGQQGRLDEAAASYRQVLRFQPDCAEAHNNLGNVLKDQGQLVEALACYREALRHRPDYADAHQNLGTLLGDQGDLKAATASFARALALAPQDGLRIKVALALPVILESTEEMQRQRRRIEAHVTRLLGEKLTLEDPANQVGRTAFELAYHGHNDRALQAAIATLFTRAAPSLTYVAPHCKAAAPSPARRPLRVGILSSYFCQHTLGLLTAGIIRQLSRDEFRVILFRFPGKDDAFAQFIDEGADTVVRLPPHLKQARQQVAEHQLDVLFYPDIGMAPLTYFLSFARLAPVQCVSWAGFPVTTGIPAIDYFISSELLETGDADRHYTERLVRLKTLPTYYYRPAPVIAPRGRRFFGLADEDHLYGCLQSLFKFHPDFDAILAAILRRDPQGRLVLIEGKHAYWWELLLQRWTRLMPDVVDRIILLPRQSRDDFLHLSAACDVLLDPLHFGSGNTCYEGLAQGVPIVTWPGQFLRGRVTLGLYRKMGVLDCVAANADEYVDIAVRLAAEPDYRTAIRAKILDGNHVIFEDGGAVRELEEFFKDAVAQAPLMRAGVAGERESVRGRS